MYDPKYDPKYDPQWPTPPCQIGNWGGGGIHVIPATPELKSDADLAGEICEKYLICT